MGDLFSLKNNKDNIHILAFQYRSLYYSLEVLKNKRRELRKNPELKEKINYYVSMEKILLTLSGNEYYTVKRGIDSYLSQNPDLKDYVNIVRHIVAKELDLAGLLNRVDFKNHSFYIEGKDLVCIDSAITTKGNLLNDEEKDYLCSCAKKSKRVISVRDLTAEQLRKTFMYTSAY